MLAGFCEVRWMLASKGRCVSLMGLWFRLGTTRATTSGILFGITPKSRYASPFNSRRYKCEPHFGQGLRPSRVPVQV
jgi:hypothetical protein